MKEEIVRIYARYGAMPEIALEELKARSDHTTARAEQLAREMGEHWQVWSVQLPKHHPAKKGMRIHENPRPNTRLRSDEGLVAPPAALGAAA
jgi:hypothetical protein